MNVIQSKTNRFFYIDVLRASSILGVIAIHVLAYNLNSPLNKFIANYLQFVVLAFVFCSGYVLASPYYLGRINSLTKSIDWFKKRLVRLLIPYYLYLFSHYTLWLLFPHFFSGLGLQRSIGFFARSLILANGVDISWLPLLFIELSLIYLLFIKIYNNKKFLSLYIVFAVCTTILIFLHYLTGISYRITMWIPWSIILLAAILIGQYEEKDKKLSQSIKRYGIIGIVGLIFFIIFSLNIFTTHQELIFRNHKYPPDFIYLSYATGATFIFLIFCRLFNTSSRLIKELIEFISNNSYQLFFIHFIVFDAVLHSRSIGLNSFGALSQFTIVTIISLCFVFLIKQIKKYPQK